MSIFETIEFYTINDNLFPTDINISDLEDVDVLEFFNDKEKEFYVLKNILEKDDVVGYYAYCKSIKQQPFTIFLNKTHLFEIALIYNAIDIADYILISSQCSNYTRWINYMAALLWSFEEKEIHKILLRFIEYPKHDICRNITVIENTMTAVYSLALEFNDVNKEIEVINVWRNSLRDSLKNYDIVKDSNNKIFLFIYESYLKS